MARAALQAPVDRALLVSMVRVPAVARVVRARVLVAALVALVRVPVAPLVLVVLVAVPGGVPAAIGTGRAGPTKGSSSQGS